MTSSDGRIPVVFRAIHAAEPGDVVVRADAAPSAGHAAFCGCCTPRGALAQALGRLFLAQARGGIAPPRRVVVQTADPAAARAALEGDALVMARFRLEPPPSARI